MDLQDVMEWRKKRLKELCSPKAFGTRADLGRALGYTDGSYIGQMIRGDRAITEKTIDEIEKLRNGSFRGWFTPPIQGVKMTEPTKLTEVVISSDMPFLAWENLMQLDDVPDRFWTAAPDNALAPRLSAGRHLLIDRTLAPRGGDAVLVKDSSGSLHLRIYVPGPAGRWTAVPDNTQHFHTLESDRDGLKIIGVLDAVQGRWG